MYSIERLPPRELDTSWIKDPFDNICVEFMMNSDIYQRSFDYRSQCHNSFMFLKTFKWSVCKVSKLFSVDHKALEKQLSLPVEQRKNGRPPSLSNKEQQILMQKLHELIANKKFPALYDMEQICVQIFHKIISVFYKKVLRQQKL